MKWILLCFSLCFFAFAHGQKIEVSSTQKLSNRTPKVKVLGANEQGIVVMKYGKGSTAIDIYRHKDLSVAATNFLSFRDGNSQEALVMQLDAVGARVFFSEHRKGLGYIKFQTLNSRFNKQGASVVVDSIEYNRYLFESNLSALESENKQFVLFYLPAFSSGGMSGIYYWLTNREGQLIQKGSIDNFGDDKERGIFKIARLSNQGDIIFVVQTRLERSEQRDGVIAPMQCYYISKQGDQRQFDFQAQYQTYGDLGFKIDNRNRRFTIVGMFNDGSLNDRRSANGVFMESYSLNDRRWMKGNYYLFTSDFFVELTGEDYTETKVGLKTFRPNYMQFTLDGGVLLMLESYYKETDQVSAGPSLSSPDIGAYKTIDRFNYNDVAVFHFGPTGKMKYHKLLKKRQISENDDGLYSSYTYANLKDQLVFYFVDDVYGRGEMRSVSLLPNGQIKSKSVLNITDYNSMPVVKMAKQISPDQIVIPSYHKGNFKLLRLRH